MDYFLREVFVHEKVSFKPRVAYHLVSTWAFDFFRTGFHESRYQEAKMIFENSKRAMHAWGITHATHNHEGSVGHPTLGFLLERVGEMIEKDPNFGKA